jgi:hypothetical protein
LINGGRAEPDVAELEAKIRLSARKTTAGQVASMGGLESVVLEPPKPIAVTFDKDYAYAIVTKDDFLPLWQGVQTVAAAK